MIRLNPRTPKPFFSTHEEVTMKLTVRFATLTLGVSMGLVGTANALQPLITDDTGTQDTGNQQLEWSYARAKVTGSNQKSHENAVVYTYGVTPELDVYAAATRVSATSSGWANPVLGAKWRFYADANEETTLALKPELALPVSAQRELDELGSGKPSGSLTLILSRTMPFGAMHFNLVMGQDRFRQSSPFNNTHYQRISMAPVWSINDRLSLALDIGSERTREAGQSTTKRFHELGMMYALREDLDWAIGVIKESTPDEKTTTLTTGLTLRY